MGPETRDLRLLYVAPWAALSQVGGAVPNALATTRELAAYADLTVAFRRLTDPLPDVPFRLVAIEPHLGTSDSPYGAPADGPLDYLRYLRRLQAFAADNAPHYDVVIEKGWRMLGYVTSLFHRHGVPGIAVDSTVRQPSTQGGVARRLFGRVSYAVQRRLVGGYLQQTEAVVAETSQLRDILIRTLGIPPCRIHIIGLGVDHSLFRPLPRAAARAELGIDPEERMLLYSGTLDRGHDLRPLAQAVMRQPRGDVRLRLLAVGRHRGEYEAIAAASGGTVVMHDPVPQDRVPTFIAAADMCVAPYDPRLFPDGVYTGFSLKIPEYMACGRSVAGTVCSRLRDLITDGKTGFLLPNETEAWAALLANLPSREQLDVMGDAARAAVADLTWASVAAQYWELCRHVGGFPPAEGRA